MATSERGLQGPFLFVGGCKNGQWLYCSEQYVKMPIDWEPSSDPIISEEIEYECYRRRGVRICSGEAIYYVYVAESISPDEAMRLLMREYRGKEND